MAIALPINLAVRTQLHDGQKLKCQILAFSASLEAKVWLYNPILAFATLVKVCWRLLGWVFSPLDVQEVPTPSILLCDMMQF